MAAPLSRAGAHGRGQARAVLTRLAVLHRTCRDAGVRGYAGQA